MLIVVGMERLLPIVRRGHTSHVLEGTHEVGIGIEATLVSHLDEADHRILIQEVASLLDLESLDIARGGIARQRMDLAVELSTTHAHGEGDRCDTDLFITTELHIDEVGYLVQEAQIFLLAGIGVWTKIGILFL